MTSFYRAYGATLFYIPPLSALFYRMLYPQTRVSCSLCVLCVLAFRVLCVLSLCVFWRFNALQTVGIHELYTQTLLE